MAIRAVISFLLLSLLPSNSSTDCSLKSMQNVCRKQGGHNPFCEYKISPHCDDVKPPQCHDTHNGLNSVEGCKITRFGQGEGCGSLKPSHITPPEESLVDLHLYHHLGFWGSEGLVNMTFTAPAWEDLRFQYKFVGSGIADSCRQISLSSPVNATLMYDCHIMKKAGNNSMNALLTVQSDTREGASYLFRVPPGYRINPEKTCPGDWHVFFYIHQDAIQQHKRLPVTIQSAPFGQAVYKVVLARCVGSEDGDDEDKGDEDKECQDFKELDSMVETRNTTDDLWTVNLPKVAAAGKYMIRVQIVSDWCPQPQGCHVSVSPKFEIISNSTWTEIGLTISVLLIFLISIVVLIHLRRKVNKKFFRDLKNWQPTVFLAYHPESQASLHFVNTLANFLENTCCMHPLMADREAAWQDPIQWTKTEMTNANRVMFIIPKDLEAQSVTIMRDLWKVALNHCSGHEFTTSQDKKVAKLLLPTCGHVPWQIGDVRRFDLNQNPAALATWLHSGSWMDQVFMWWPHIRSSTTKKITPTWQDVKLAAREMESPMKLNTTVGLTPMLASPERDVSVMRNPHNSISSCVKKDDQENGNPADDNVEASTEKVFDPQIPDVDSLCGPQQGSRGRLSSSSKSSLEAYEDEWNIF